MADIRELTDEHFPEVMRITGDAYPSMGVFTDEARATQLERFKESRRDQRWIPARSRQE